MLPPAGECQDLSRRPRPPGLTFRQHGMGVLLVPGQAQYSNIGRIYFL